MRKKRIGLVTGGGDCPGLNAVIRAAVLTAIRDHGLDVLGIQLGFEGLLAGATIPLTLESIRGILPKGGTLLRTTNRGNPFGWIALYSGMAGGADIILVPEIPYMPAAIVRRIMEREEEGAKFDIIVVAEGACRAGGEESYLDKASRRLGGVAYQVTADIAQQRRGNSVAWSRCARRRSPRSRSARRSRNSSTSIPMGRWSPRREASALHSATGDRTNGRSR